MVCIRTQRQKPPLPEPTILFLFAGFCIVFICCILYYLVCCFWLLHGKPFRLDGGPSAIGTQHNTTNTWQSAHIYIISMVSKAINMHIHKQPKCGLHIHRAFAIWPATALKKQKCITVLRIKWLAGWLGTVFTI